METSYTNATPPLEQGQGTVGCPTKGPDCTPPPEVEHMTGDIEMEMDDTFTMTYKGTTPADGKVKDVTANLDLGNGYVGYLAKSPLCTPPPGVTLKAAPEERARQRDLSRELKTEIDTES